MPKEHDPFLSGCVALDLEVGRHDGVIHAFGAVRADDGGSLTYPGGGLNAALEELDAFADSASFVLGHNLIAFDLCHLAAKKPDLRLLRLPAVDTLRLSPLAFPRNPYHHLVKHYQDGGLRRRQLNDPELDAPSGTGGLRGTARGVMQDRPRSPDGVAVARHTGARRHGPRAGRILFGTPRRSPPYRHRSARGHPGAAGGGRLRHPGAGGGGRGPLRVGARLCAGMAVSGRGATRSCRPGWATSSRKRPVGAPVAGYPMYGRSVRLVP